MRIRSWCDDKRWTAHQCQTGFHFIAINDAMPLSGAGARLEGIDDEPFHKINTIRWIKRLPHRPEFGEMPTVDARYCVVNDVPGFPRLSPSRFIHIGARGQNQRGDMLRKGGSDLNRNGGAGVVTDDCRTTNAERNQELVRGFSPVFDRRLPLLQWIGVAVSDRIHGYGVVVPAKKGKHVAKLVPGSRRLVQQQDWRAKAGRRDVQSSGWRSNEGPFDLRHINFSQSERCPQIRPTRPFGQALGSSHCVGQDPPVTIMLEGEVLLVHHGYHAL